MYLVFGGPIDLAQMPVRYLPPPKNDTLHPPAAAVQIIRIVAWCYDFVRVEESSGFRWL